VLNVAQVVNVTVMSGLSPSVGVVFYKHSSRILRLLRNCYAGETRVADVWRSMLVFISMQRPYLFLSWI
jgi:hypothetical protein